MEENLMHQAMNKIYTLLCNNQSTVEGFVFLLNDAHGEHQKKLQYQKHAGDTWCIWSNSTVKRKEQEFTSKMSTSF